MNCKKLENGIIVPQKLDLSFLLNATLNEHKLKNADAEHDRDFIS